MEASRLSPRLFVLGVILIFYLVFGALYAYKTPRWQAPDEPAHFNYVRQVAETATFPVLVAGDYDQAYLEKIKAEKFPPTASIDAIRYESHQPPLYYILAAPVYLAARAAGVDVVIALRLFSVGLGALLLVLAYRVLTLVFAPTGSTTDNALLALAGVGFIATLPMHVAMSAAINNDTFAEVVVAALVLIALLRAQGRLDTRRFILLGGSAYGLALLTKTTIYPSALLLIGAEVAGRKSLAALNQTSEVFKTSEVWDSRLGALVLAAKRSGIGRSLLSLFSFSLILSFAWFLRNVSIYGLTDPFAWARHDAVVTGQPTTVEWLARYGLKNVLADFTIVTFKSFWAQFGWMGVLVNDRIYVALFLLTAMALLGAVLWTVRMIRPYGIYDARKTIAAQAVWGWALLGILLATTVAAHAWYNLKFVQAQGRYLFPALIPIAALFGVGLHELFDKRYARLIFGLLYVALLALDYAALFWFIVPQLSG